MRFTEITRYAPAAALLTALILCSAVASAATISVNSLADVTADDGSCVLREAIVSANTNVASGTMDGECAAGEDEFDTIVFAIPACDEVCSIQPTSALPVITEQALVDGLSQPGTACSSWSPLLQIELDGSKAGQDIDGIRIRADETIVRGLIINRFDQDGIEIDADEVAVECNFIGTDVEGLRDFGNGRDGVRVDASTLNHIGGVLDFQRNLISGNGDDGVDVRGGSFANHVEGNFIGTDVFGTTALGNDDAGVRIGDRSFQNTIGGLEVRSGNVLSGNMSGLLITGESSENIVQGNFIGTDPTGSAPVANRDDGIQIVNSSTNFIGTAREGFICDGGCNLVSGNAQDGIVLVSPQARDNIIRGNFVGVNRLGTISIRNTANGVIMFAGASENLIGGPRPGEGNLISGNGQDGIQILNGLTTGNIVRGNFIGTDATGRARLSNGNDGIEIYLGSSANVIGGGSGGGGSGNVISGNNQDGIKIRDLATENLIQGNCIGVSVDGAVALGNLDDGVDIGGPEVGDAPRNQVGGVGFSDGNLIAFNTDRGVELSSGSGNAVLRNSMNRNGALGIDLASDGPTANDSGDPDFGPNNLQNSPVLVSATGDASMTLTLAYRVLSAPANATYPLRVEFFLADSDQQEGAVFLGSDLYASIEAQQQVSVSFVPNGAVTTGSAIVATATDANDNTSEFSVPIIVGGGATSDTIFADDFENFVSTLECLR